jgi:arsenate reductase
MHESMEWSGYETLLAFVKERVGEYDRIPGDRKKELNRLADEIRTRLTAGNQVEILFICTHNSRRSHMGQIWAQLAAGHYGVEHVQSFSGGTEATLFDPRTVKAMKEGGFQIKTIIPGSNPVYRVGFPGASAEDRVFSKKYTDPPNPTRGFIAVMTCSDADEGCPVIYGSDARFSITYEDPKAYDGTQKEREAYADSNRRIAREMLYLFSRIQA